MCLVQVVAEYKEKIPRELITKFSGMMHNGDTTKPARPKDLNVLSDLMCAISTLGGGGGGGGWGGAKLGRVSLSVSWLKYATATKYVHTMYT